MIRFCYLLVYQRWLLILTRFSLNRTCNIVHRRSGNNGITSICIIIIEILFTDTEGQYKDSITLVLLDNLYFSKELLDRKPVDNCSLIIVDNSVAQPNLRKCM